MSPVTLTRRLVSNVILSLTLGLPALAQSPAKPLEVVASFSILGDLAREVGRERIRVTTLVGPDADAHVYRATPADAKAVKEAGLVIVNGLGFEGFMDRLVKGSGTKAAMVIATANLRPIEKPRAGHGHSHGHDHDHGKLDPHAWQSVENVKTYVANIRDGLAKADPAGAAGYARNAEAYLAALSGLRSEMEGLFAAIPRERRVLLTSHDSLAYFGREFGFTLEAVQGLSTESEPSARDVARIIRLAKEKKARAVFIENMTNPKIAERIALETGARIGGTLFSDALSGEKGAAPTYIAMMRHNARLIAAALKE